MDSYASARRVGEAIVTVISEGTIPWAPRFQAPEEDWRRAIPEADAEGRISLGMLVAHVRLPGASILVDAGLGDPASAWQQTFATRWPGLVRTPGLHAWMAGEGISPEAITHVLITHAHEDHYAGVAAERAGQLAVRFPRARHLLGRADWDGNPRRDEAGSALASRLGLVERLGLLDLVDGDCEVVPGVAMLPAPGESPGHCAVRIRSRGAGAYFLGDLLHHGCEVAHPDWAPGQNRDRAGLLASRARLYAEIAADQALAVFTHEPFPGWGRIVPDGTGYRWVREA
jgi:glyoxylase-like metal-dependent hydrolase (beta-lactamase superfamily II)